MRYENHRLVLLASATVSVISLMLFPVNESIKNVAAAPIATTSNNTMKINRAYMV